MTGPFVPPKTRSSASAMAPAPSGRLDSGSRTMQWLKRGSCCGPSPPASMRSAVALNLVTGGSLPTPGSSRDEKVSSVVWAINSSVWFTPPTRSALEAPSAHARRKTADSALGTLEPASATEDHALFARSQMKQSPKRSFWLKPPQTTRRPGPPVAAPAMTQDAWYARGAGGTPVTVTGSHCIEARSRSANSIVAPSEVAPPKTHM
mmetsp:Transcript_7465/g.21841  ORF Transcript_7465/g.21841 Transcript_7465/m.21841 type:complete len:206 (-) Transcript_7465:973-1590(-)